MGQMVFGKPFPQIRREQQRGIPVYINKSHTHGVMLTDFASFEDPRGEKRNRLLGEGGAAQRSAAQGEGFPPLTLMKQNSALVKAGSTIDLEVAVFDESFFPHLC
jgi:hypothetical protein